MTMTNKDGNKPSDLVESTQQIHLNFVDKSTDSSLMKEDPALSEEALAIEQGTALVSDQLAEELFLEINEIGNPVDVVASPSSGVGATSRPDFESPEAAPVVETFGPLSLPAALCDEQLLKELSAIPTKMGFKIGEVAELLGIKQYVLRYWETEFDVLKPKKAANNQRYYTRKDVENVFLIRKLLHRDRFSIEGARAALKELKTVVRKEKDWSQVTQKVDLMQERLETLIADLRSLKQAFH